VGLRPKNALEGLNICYCAVFLKLVKNLNNHKKSVKTSNDKKIQADEVSIIKLKILIYFPVNENRK